MLSSARRVMPSAGEWMVGPVDAVWILPRRNDRCLRVSAGFRARDHQERIEDGPGSRTPRWCARAQPGDAPAAGADNAPSVRFLRKCVSGVEVVGDVVGDP